MRIFISGGEKVISFFPKAALRYEATESGHKSIDVFDAYGLSTDEKPVMDVGNGSLFREMDTSKTFLFDEEHGVWLEQQ